VLYQICWPVRPSAQARGTLVFRYLRKLNRQKPVSPYVPRPSGFSKLRVYLRVTSTLPAQWQVRVSDYSLPLISTSTPVRFSVGSLTPQTPSWLSTHLSQACLQLF
jgi:hypothetical protein